MSAGADTNAVPSAAAADVYAPYGQLIKMLLPRIGSIAIYDADGVLLWCSDGYERLDLRPLVESLQTPSTAQLPAGGGIRSTPAGTPAFVNVLRGELGQALGSVLVELPGGDARAPSVTMVASLLRPVFDCLQNRMDLERTIVDQADEAEEDVDLLLAADEDLNEHRSAFEQLLEHCAEHLEAAIGVLQVPEKGLSVSSGPEAAALASGGAGLGRPHRHLLAWAQLNDRPMVVNQVSPSAGADAMPYKIVSCPVRDPNQRVIGIIALFRSVDAPDFELRDVRILEFASRKIVNLLTSQHDPLTGMVNCLVFERRVQRRLDASEPPRRQALVYVDIDSLHVLNDAFGFEAGDEVIQRVAGLIRTELGPDDLASRTGGDRFTVFLPDRDLAGALRLAERIRDAVAELGYLSAEQPIGLSVSIGVAECPPQQPVGHAVAAAERACKQARHGGGNRVEAHAGAAGRAPPRLFAAARIRQALTDDQLSLETQPLCRLADGRPAACEVFLPLRNPDGTAAAAGKFLAAAERHELMPALDRWVVATTLDVLHAAPGAAADLGRVMLNISCQSLGSRQFLDFLSERLRDSGVAPGLLCFELNERAALNRLQEAERFLHGVADLGCSVALDDFGRGLSSLAHLKRLPVQYLKIDGALIRLMLQDRLSESLVVAIARAAETLDVTTVAEHVESAAVAGKLRRLGVELGQGYHFGRPSPFGQWLDGVSPPDAPPLAERARA